MEARATDNAANEGQIAVLKTELLATKVDNHRHKFKTMQYDNRL
jgi:hypothetical protein